jgi:hypothetical protein
MSREKVLHLHPAARTLPATDDPKAAGEEKLQESSINYSPDSDPNYFRDLVTDLQRVGSSFLPSPEDPTQLWSPSYHSSFTLLCFKYSSLASLVPLLPSSQFSVLVSLHLFLLLWWKNFLFLLSRIWAMLSHPSPSATITKTTIDVTLLSDLEKLFSFEPTSGVDRASVRLWHDDETVKVSE